MYQYSWRDIYAHRTDWSTHRGLGLCYGRRFSWNWSYPQHFARLLRFGHKIGYPTGLASHTIIGMKTSRISPHRTWHGVRMPRTQVSPAPHPVSRSVHLP